MNTSFANGFADFLEERLGDALFVLREKNEEYRDLSGEYATLLKSQFQTIDEYKLALSQITDIVRKLGDIEKRYLFLAGMREHAGIEDALSSEAFETLFTGIN